MKITRSCGHTEEVEIEGIEWTDAEIEYEQRYPCSECMKSKERK